jgi:hypothetical protein
MLKEKIIACLYIGINFDGRILELLISSNVITCSHLIEFIEWFPFEKRYNEFLGTYYDSRQCFLKWAYEIDSITRNNLGRHQIKSMPSLAEKVYTSIIHFWTLKIIGWNCWVKCFPTASKPRAEMPGKLSDARIDRSSTPLDSSRV